MGFGSDTAVSLLIAVGENPDRLDSEASFAALCGVSPVERPRDAGSTVGSTVVAIVRQMPRSIASC
ncbi:transposase [Streptomyces sp. NPDC023838]|uniref:transposase n=1 Tax=Streptomyces sp. NPDC023838 TaxID=3154325 RepID=UPI0033F16123